MPEDSVFIVKNAQSTSEAHLKRVKGKDVIVNFDINCMVVMHYAFLACIEGKQIGFFIGNTSSYFSQK